MNADPMSLDFGTHKHVLLSGATGFIGTALCRELLAAGHRVTVISRRPVKAARQFEGRVEAIASADELLASDAIDLIINLAGAPV
ncbi:MAG TPA: NAD-dependent epimerase/dehydratase family protein, partial [Pseudomonadaceae bacterium]|nr:NAD-dependent epimerase/dehydratase family protein [Pseudomonadaceae bacterium]